MAAYIEKPCVVAHLKFLCMGLLGENQPWGKEQTDLMGLTQVMGWDGAEILNVMEAIT